MRRSLSSVFCPNCMSPYLRPFVPDDEEAEDISASDEPLMECPECDWVGPVTEAMPENYR